MNSELLDRIEQLEKQNRELNEQNDVLRTKNEALQLKVQSLLQRIFGRRSEKFGENPDQLHLFEDELLSEAKKEIEAELANEAEEEEEPRRPSRRNGRKPLPKDLPRKRVEYHPEPEETLCDCCGKEMKPIGEDITEELEYIPASVFVVEHARIKYACPDCQEGVVIAPLPARPIEKGRPGPGLLAYLAVSKYADHLPLNRLERIFSRYGIELTRSTLCDWVGYVATLLLPVVKELKRTILAASVIQADETPVDYREGPKGRTLQGYVWTYGVPWAEVVYEFTTTRSRDGPTQFLADYSGYLQTDGYSGYNEVCRSGRVSHIGCMTHVRRGFHQALDEAPEESAAVIMAIQKLYRIERAAKEARLDPESKVKLRKEKALPILTALKELLDEYQKTALPESNFGQAVDYAINQWESILRYVEVGEAEIDNNSAEQTMRDVVLGRKNYLFFGSPAGGQRAATIYSVVASCKRLGINPYTYLRDVIERISTHPMSRIYELTPRGWKESLESRLSGAGEPPSGAENPPQASAR